VPVWLENWMAGLSRFAGLLIFGMAPESGPPRKIQDTRSNNPTN